MSFRECGARARTNGHQPCRQPAMANGRCRLHGGKTCNTGAKTPEGKLRQKMASWKTGQHSAEAKAERRAFRQMMKEYKGDIEGLL
jgi:hypothetical protein